MPAELLLLFAEGMMALDQGVVEQRVEAGMRKITGFEVKSNRALGLNAQARITAASGGYFEGGRRSVEWD